MLRLYRKTICPRWHVNRKNSSEKKYQNCIKPKALVQCSASQKQNHSNQDHEKKQHAHKQDKRCWDDPQFHFNFFRTSVFETAGWLGTTALCFNYHLKHINSILEHERNNSSCLFSNIVFALPRRHSEDEKLSTVHDSHLPTQTMHNSEKDKISSDADILKTIKTLNQQYAAAVENSVGVRSISNNDKRAFRSFQSAARHGSSAGFYNLGLCYHLGKGTRKNLNMAAFCYRKATMKGHGLASFNLATFFFKGMGGLPVDTKIAKELLAEAAEKNVPEAQLYFGILFLEEKRWLDAVRIFANLAEKNLPDAQYYLGLCYESGLGVKRNKKVAVELFAKAADQGNKRALDKLQNYKESRDGKHHSFLKSAVVKDIERSNNLHVSASFPELGAVVKKTNQSIMKFPILSYLDLFTPLLIVKNNDSKAKDKFVTDDNKLIKGCSSTFLSFKSIPLVVMEVKT